MFTGTSVPSSFFSVLIGFRCPSLPTTARPKPNPFNFSSFGPIISSFLGSTYPSLGLAGTPSTPESFPVA